MIHPHVEGACTHNPDDPEVCTTDHRAEAERLLERAENGEWIGPTIDACHHLLALIGALEAELGPLREGAKTAIALESASRR